MFMGVTPTILRPMVATIVSSALSPADKTSNIVLSNGNASARLLSSTGNYELVRGTKLSPTGVSEVRQFEVLLDTVGSQKYLQVGIATAAAPLSANTYWGATAASTSVDCSGFIYFNGQAKSTAFTAVSGGKLGVTFNTTTALASFYLNGALIGTQQLPTGLQWLPALALIDAPDAATLNTGGSPFSYPVSGAISWG